MKALIAFLKANYRTLFSVSVLAAVFYCSILQNYLLFHTIVELFSIVVAFAVFIVAWNTRNMQDNPYLRFVGIAYIAIAALDLLHTLTFKGMNIIPANERYYANQFWVATRLLEALTFVAGFYFINYRKRISADLIFLSYFVLTLLITLSILVYKNFPRCYLDGLGQTPFKIYAEYFIIAILFVAGWLLFQYRQHFSSQAYRLLSFSLFFTVISEFCFTLYVSNYSTANEIGHYAKLIAFFLIYKANVESGFLNPTGTIFRGLKEDEQKYRTLAQNVPELEDKNAMKDKLFSIIAHDLKNPFTSMLSFSEMISKNADRMEIEKVKRMGQRINESGKQAFVLLENLLNWSRVQSGLMKPNFQQVLIDDIYKDALTFASPAAEAKSIRLIVKQTDELTVFADRLMIDTVLRNLLSNAIKFTHHGGIIEINGALMNNEVTIAVQDSGVGIEPALQEEILEISARHTTNGTDNEKGTGLGLVLCKEFVELNNGRIWLESKVGQGTTIYFSLPTPKNLNR
ncbi:MASE3 domain-containing protein [Mucilaginibacter sp. PAMB04168]|uniref:sensor histidine kinase n=1 Tax=Mucilaginibacter sp. PAMB04168 TaxID=3138567 RepID=UPI0031F712F1